MNNKGRSALTVHFLHNHNVNSWKPQSFLPLMNTNENENFNTSLCRIQMWKREFPKQSGAWYKQPKKNQKCLQPWGWTATNQIERSTIAPYSLFTQLSPECQTTSTRKLSLSSLQPLWKNNSTSKYWSRVAVRISRQYASVAAGGFILISNLTEFSPRIYILICCSQCIDIFFNLFFFFGLQ